jgi:ribosomal protein L37AE/L43A
VAGERRRSKKEKVKRKKRNGSIVSYDWSGAGSHAMKGREGMPRWAQRVPQAKIRQLYETDARGLYDEELIDEVGWALYARCRSLIEAEEARQGRAKCHQCDEIIAHSAKKEEVLRCPACGWEITWGEYFRSIQHKQLSGPDLVGIFTEFTAGFPRAAKPQQKMLLIDRLVHSFHWSADTGPRRPSAVNLIEGKMGEVIAFLDQLSYGKGSTPGTKRQRAAWRKSMSDALERWGSPRIDGRRKRS